MLYSCTYMATVGVKLWQQSFLNDSAHPISSVQQFHAHQFHHTIYLFLLSDCLLLDVAPSLAPVLAYGTTYRSMSPQHYLCTPSEND